MVKRKIDNVFWFENIIVEKWVFLIKKYDKKVKINLSI